MKGTQEHSILPLQLFNKSKVIIKLKGYQGLQNQA